MRMYKGVRKFIRISLFSVSLLTIVAMAYAGNAQPDDMFSPKDIIMLLFALLQTVFLGIGVWLIANDKELFTRMAKVEKSQEVRDAVCDERWNSDSHPVRRIGDKVKN
jgi:uncharacterized membrane protein YcjF (UPF0283 family)